MVYVVRNLCAYVCISLTKAPTLRCDACNCRERRECPERGSLSERERHACRHDAVIVRSKRNQGRRAFQSATD
jgi:hypothetical protein